MSDLDIAQPQAITIPTNPSSSIPFQHQAWLHAAKVGLQIWAIVLLYDFFYFQGNLGQVLSESMAAVGGVLIGISFVLSVITYFFDYFDHQLQYRKQYGLVGYFFALAYSFGLLMRFPEQYLWGLPARLTELEVLLGLGAMAILTFMAIISFPYFMRKMGLWWRPALRLGYLAYALLILRAVIVEHVVWENWLSTLPALPPPRLVLTVFAMTVIILRVEMQLMIWGKKLIKSEPAPATPPSSV